MEDVIAKLRKRQLDLMEDAFEHPPSDLVGWTRIRAEWYGIGQSIATIEQEGKKHDEDEDGN